MIDEDLDELLKIAAAISAIGTFALDIAIHIKRDGKQKEKPHNRLKRRKRKR